MIKSGTKMLKIEDGFVIERQTQWGPTGHSVRFDLTVRKDGFLTAVFDIHGGPDTATGAGLLIPYYVFNHTQAPLCIVYNVENHTFFLYTREKIEIDNDDKDYYKDYYDGEKKIQERYFHDSIINDLPEVVRRIKEISESRIANNKTRTNTSADSKYRLKIIKDNALDPQWCRNQLGGDYKGERVCRYSSLDSLFCSLTHGTFRMNGLPGMNDKNEGLFAWDLINPRQDLSNEVGKKRQELSNNVFIISYSSVRDDMLEEPDDLSMWRLYGDDSKGVCCIYSVRKDEIKDRFFLHDVKYIAPPKGGVAQDDPLLASLKRHVDNHPDLEVLDFSPVIFYYKHKDYEPESEVRLLVDNKKSEAYKRDVFERKWLLTSSNNIPNPYIDVEMKEFPLKLERIILGPNMNDIDIIQGQLETMLKELGIDATVEASKKTSYRNPIKG